MMPILSQGFSGLAGYLSSGIWRIRLADVPGRKAAWIRLLRTILLSVSKFLKDDCTFKASALTFFSLLSIVPMAAMAFGIAHGFGFEEKLQAQLLENFAAQKEIVSKVIEFSKALLENTKGGLMAGMGLIVLFWSVIKLLGNIERSFNDIWEVVKPRSLGNKFTDYLSIILIGPILILLSGSTTIFITTQITHIIEKISLLGWFSPVIYFFLQWLPYALIWILFTFVYLFMPNIRVRFSSAFFAGITAGTIYQLTQWAYIHFQVGIAKYNAIYGSFAALPLFLIWLQISWFIVLFGAELSYAHQNSDTYEFEPDRHKLSHFFKRTLSLRVMHMIAKAFTDQTRSDAPSVTMDRICQKLKLPERLARQTINELIDAGLVTEIHHENGEAAAYQPALDINRMTLETLLSCLDQKNGIAELPVVEDETFDAIKASLSRFYQGFENAPENRLIHDL